jgi:hypothetical protein
MQLRRFWLTVRRLMIVVAVVAMLLGGVVWLRQCREAFHERGLRYFHACVEHSTSLSKLLFVSHQFPKLPFDTRPAGAHVRLMEHYKFMAEKYLSAARYPWLPVEPDPPPPE